MSDRGDEGQKQSETGAQVPRQRWIVIRDRVELGRMLEVAWRGKKQADIEKRYGIRQPLVSELLKAKLDRITLESYRTLRRAVGVSWWRLKMEPLFLAPGAAGALESYKGWMIRDEQTEEAQLGLSRDQRRLLRRLAYGPGSKLKKAYRALDETCAKRSCSLRRRLAAFRSAIEPLNRYYTTDGIEPGFTDFGNEKDLINFVYWGLKREELLLRMREADERRAQQADQSAEDRDDELERRDLGVSDSLFSWDFMKATLFDAEQTRLRTGWREPTVEELV